MEFQLSEDMNLYDDHEYQKCEDDVIMEGEDPEEEEDLKEVHPEEENPEEEDHKGGDSVGDNKDESFTDSNITP